MSEMAKVNLPLEEIRAYCAKQPILRLSEMAPEFEFWLRPQSAVGLLVEYVPGSGVSYFDVAGHEIDLGEIIGKGVSVHTPNGLRNGSMQEYIESARLIYAKKF